MTDVLVEAVAKALRSECLKEFGTTWDNDVAAKLARAGLAAIEANGTFVVVPVRPDKAMVSLGMATIDVANEPDCVGRRASSDIAAEAAYIAMVSARPKVEA